MRNFIFLAAVLIAASASRAAEDCACFTPSPEQIADLESRITDLPAPVYQYARYYSGWTSTATVNGQTVTRRFVQGQYLPLQGGESSGIHIVAGRRLPPPKAEGCIANYDVPLPSDAFEIYARCNRPGGWLPGAAEIGEVERALALPSGARPLNRYARHYAGITESGVRLIRGVFVAMDGTAPGIFVGTEIDLPLAGDDGCAIVEVNYNAETKLGSVRCGGAN